ncbi:MAG: polysaccharide biosynthesis/export family protein [Acidobacteria bacterium]|nr:polysaccharide biosynthesis/export family protein [Acidobacteriota bacterium]
MNWRSGDLAIWRLREAIGRLRAMEISRLLIVPAICFAISGTAFAQEPPPAANGKPNDKDRAAFAKDARDSRAAEMAVEYQIGPEDVLDISVWKNTELSRVVPVRPDGKISLPLLNDIQAAGLTPSALREQLREKLGEYVPSPEVSVIVREVHSFKVAVVGSVKTPGRFELKSPATVLEMLALAQGLTEFASRDRIFVLRNQGGTTTRVPFNYRRVAEGAEQDNFFVRPGDIIVVP